MKLTESKLRRIISQILESVSQEEKLHNLAKQPKSIMSAFSMVSTLFPEKLAHKAEFGYLVEKVLKRALDIFIEDVKDWYDAPGFMGEPKRRYARLSSRKIGEARWPFWKGLDTTQDEIAEKHARELDLGWHAILRVLRKDARAKTSIVNDPIMPWAQGVGSFQPGNAVVNIAGNEFWITLGFSNKEFSVTIERKDW